ncbi:MAG: cytochrome c biogenesis protein ResB [Acidobacteriota bacterium]|nr:MAG: cytochrome c biogenesis protein ResB [Acidobacteriota bacterium]
MKGDSSGKEKATAEGRFPISEKPDIGGPILALIEFAGSVRLGIVLLILIIIASILGMIITQQNVPGFDSYYAGLSEFERNLFSALGLFDVYHSWYFITLLALLALNIVLASVDRFPRTLRLVRNPNIEPSTEWVGTREFSAAFAAFGSRQELRKLAEGTLGRSGFRKPVVTERPGRTIIFAESGSWNRLGAYPVHLALLTILFAGSISAMFGLTGEMTLSRGQSSDRIRSTVFRDGRSMIAFEQLPFSVRCTDLRQKLIDPRGSIEVENSLDWITDLKIEDGAGSGTASVSLNRPLDHKGYRFFHSSFIPIGKARSVTVEVGAGSARKETVTLAQGESASISGGYSVKFVDFRSNMDSERQGGTGNSTSYENPAAILEITDRDGSSRSAFAFELPQRDGTTSLNSFRGLDLKLTGFERVSESHVLFVQYDPGVRFLYAGFLLLAASLIAVFFFSHKRVWIAIEESEDDGQSVTIGGDTNRNHLAFEERFRKIVEGIGTRSTSDGQIED